MKKRIPKYRMLTAPLAGAVLLLLSVATPLHAQDGEGGALDSLLRLPIATTLSTPVATASKAFEMTREAPASVTIITASDIRRFGYRTIDEALNRIPGFYLSNDRSYTYVGVRGFGRPSDYNNRIVLLLNGHLMNESFYGSALLGSEFALDMGAVDRIEVVRGPGSTLYGGGAMLAVINVITRDGSDGAAGTLTADAGSYGRTGLAAQYGFTAGEDFRFFASGQWSEMDGQSLSFPEYDTDSTLHGIADRLDHEHTGGMVATLAYGPLQLQGSYATRRYGVATGMYETVFGDPRNEAEDSKGFLELSAGMTPLPSLALLVRAYYDYYDYQGSYPYEEMLHDATRASGVGSELHAVWDPIAENRLIAGIEINRQTRSDYRSWQGDEPLFNENYPFSIASLFAEDMLHVNDDLSASIGVRFDHYSDLGSFASPRAAVVWQFSDGGSLKLLAGQAFRMPNRYERYYTDSASGYKANPTLSPERSVTLETAIEQQVTTGLNISCSVFHYRLEDLIDPREDPDDGMVQYVNAGDLLSDGVELACSVQPFPWLSGYANYTLQFPEAEEPMLEDKGVVNSPRRLFRAGASVESSGVALFLEGGAESSRRTVLDTTSTTPFGLLHAGMSYRPRFLEDGGGMASLLSRLEFSAVCRNLLDAAYAHPAGLELRQTAIRQNGRNFRLRLRIYL